MKIKFTLLSFLLFFFLLFLPFYGIGQKRIGDLTQRKNDIEKRIANTNELIRESSRDQKVNTERIELLNSKLYDQNALIENIAEQIDILAQEVNLTLSRIDSMEHSLDLLKEQYAKFLQTIQFKGGEPRALYVILGSRTFSQIYRRFRFYCEYSQYRTRQYDTICARENRLKEQYKQLQNDYENLELIRKEYTEAKRTMVEEQSAYQSELERLRSQEKKLMLQLQKDKDEITSLNKEIARLLKEEAMTKKNLLSESKAKEYGAYFLSQRGKLAWPVHGGVITRGYGEAASQHFKGVKTNSHGVDITLPHQATVHPVSPGIVSKVARIAGAHAIVIIRHGDYLTLYSNLISVNVAHGDIVSPTDVIGKAYYDPDEKNSRVHFEIWKGFESENPRTWLKP